MIKKTVVLAFFAISYSLCFAPNLTGILQECYKQRSATDLRKWNWENEFTRWKKELGFKESGGDWTIYNKYGCIGTYQFQVTTLRNLGFRGITFEEFKTNPAVFPEEIQDLALRALIRANAAAMHSCERYVGQTIGGVLITRSGLLAAAHLGGIGGVKSFLRRNINMRDRNGASIRGYLVKFSGYNL